MEIEFIQLWYFIARQKQDLVVILAFFSSVVSVFVALVDVYSSLSIINAMKRAKKEGYFQIETYFFSLIGSTVAKHGRLFKMRPNAMRKIFAEILECDVRCIECNSIVRIENGLEYGFTVFSLSQSNKNDTNKNNGRLNRLFRMYGSVCGSDHGSNSNINESNKGIFLQRIINCWKLDTLKLSQSNTDIDINITNIVTFYDDDNKYGSNFEHDYKAITQSSFYKLNWYMFSFERAGIYKYIAIDTMAPPPVPNTAIDDESQQIGDVIDSGLSWSNPNNMKGIQQTIPAALQAPQTTLAPKNINDSIIIHDDCSMDIDNKTDDIMINYDESEDEYKEANVLGAQAPNTRKTAISVHLSHLTHVQENKKIQAFAVDNNRYEFMRSIHEQIIADENNHNNNDSILAFEFKLNMPKIFTRFSADTNGHTKSAAAEDDALDIISIRSRSASVSSPSVPQL